MTIKHNKRGKKAGAPANLTQQLIKEIEGRNGAKSGRGAGQRRNKKGGGVAGASVNATPNKLTRGVQRCDKRGREVGASGSVTANQKTRWVGQEEAEW
jgi:hypothetical protein